MTTTRQIPRKYAAAKGVVFGLANFTIGVEAADTINVAVQLKDDRGNALSERAHLRAYLADAATGADVTATATTSALAIHTNGKIISTPVSGKMVEVISDASGRFDLDVIQTAAPVTYYLILQMPDGGLLASGAITFA